MSTKPQRVDGVDISHHQGGTLDMAGAKRRGLKWLYHKATEGTSYRDPNYDRRRAEAKRAGLPFGAYHFARADRMDARDEARAFIAYAKPVPGDLRPALDLETTEGLPLSELRRWAADFIAEVVRLVGVKPIVYTPFDLGTADDGCIIWRPRYNNSNTPPQLKWDIWQFSNGVYGVPNALSGFGKVDLNVMRDGLTLQQLLIPQPKPVVKRQRMKIAHASMQFSDTQRQMDADAKVIFARGYHWITGTEAGETTMRTILRRYAEGNGYRFFVYRSVWVAVKKSLIDGGWKTGYVPVIESNEGVGKHGDRGIAWVSFVNDELGRITIGSAHYLTKGRPNATNPEWRRNLHLNKRFGPAIGKWAMRHGAGTALVFYGGDQNIIDRTADTFFGAPMTSAWDELKRWENTGHGNIDVIASYDRDARVVARSVQALDDTELRLNMDHFLVEATYDIREL